MKRTLRPAPVPSWAPVVHELPRREMEAMFERIMGYAQLKGLAVADAVAFIMANDYPQYEYTMVLTKPSNPANMNRETGDVWLTIFGRRDK